ncbi:uncharacterized protein JN550_002089 [Neoarthrinium moseri]|uniref:uncharacterized protein n=1 Tax=Neoarthrinium moseri TaxID=1658444 RepID=UPI001FDD11AC|nr:uncharacterized protein JN550_002089 [Neoarthrinium moseri]KAI1875803.1 hypothetical protein JN550_002089 [Neoarthrinium moseri]
MASYDASSPLGDGGESKAPSDHQLLDPDQAHRNVPWYRDRHADFEHPSAYYPQGQVQPSGNPGFLHTPPATVGTPSAYQPSEISCDYDDEHEADQSGSHSRHESRDSLAPPSRSSSWGRKHRRSQQQMPSLNTAVGGPQIATTQLPRIGFGLPPPRNILRRPRSNTDNSQESSHGSDSSLAFAESPKRESGPLVDENHRQFELSPNSKGGFWPNDEDSLMNSYPLAHQSPLITISVWGKDGEEPLSTDLPSFDFPRTPDTSLPVTLKPSEAFPPHVKAWHDEQSALHQMGKHQEWGRYMDIETWISQVPDLGYIGSSWHESNSPQIPQYDDDDNIRTEPVPTERKTKNRQIESQLYYNFRGGRITDTDLYLMGEYRVWENPPILLPIVQSPWARMQPATSQAAIERFNRMDHDNGSIVSHCASWGTQPESLPSVANEDQIIAGNFLQRTSLPESHSSPRNLTDEEIQQLRQCLPHPRVASNISDVFGLPSSENKIGQAEKLLRGLFEIFSEPCAIVGQEDSESYLADVETQLTKLEALLKTRLGVYNPSQSSVLQLYGSMVKREPDLISAKNGNVGSVTPSASLSISPCPTCGSRTTLNNGRRQDAAFDVKNENNTNAGKDIFDDKIPDIIQPTLRGRLGVDCPDAPQFVDEGVQVDLPEVYKSESQGYHAVNSTSLPHFVDEGVQVDFSEDEKTRYRSRTSDVSSASSASGTTNITRHIESSVVPDTKLEYQLLDIQSNVQLRQVGLVNVQIMLVSLSPHCKTASQPDDSAGIDSDESQLDESDQTDAEEVAPNDVEHMEDMHTASGSSGVGFAGSISSSSNTGDVQGQRPKGKRSGDGEDGENRNNKRRRMLPLPCDKPKLPRLACPYQAYERFQSCLRRGGSNREGGCAGISRLKQHLSRRHMLSYRCQRCWRSFDTRGDVSNHATQQPPCDARPKGWEERFMNIDQEGEVERIGRNMSEQDAWWSLFSLLVPGMQNRDLPSLMTQYSPFYVYYHSNFMIPAISFSQLPGQLTQRGQLSEEGYTTDSSELPYQWPVDQSSSLQPNTGFAIPSPAPSVQSFPMPLLELMGEPTVDLDSSLFITPSSSGATQSSFNCTTSPGSVPPAYMSIDSPAPFDRSNIQRNYDRLKTRSVQTEKLNADFREANRANRTDIDRVDTILEDVLTIEELPDLIFERISQVSDILSVIKGRLR